MADTDKSDKAKASDTDYRTTTAASNSKDAVKPGTSDAAARDANKPSDENPAVTAYFTEDGTPVETSTIPPKVDFTQPDVEKYRPDVHERTVLAKERDLTNEDQYTNIDNAK